MAPGLVSSENGHSREILDELATETFSPEDRIRRRAHQIWIQRDGRNGSDVADWLQAEAELLAEAEE